MEPKLIKIDRNGSKHFEGYVKCDRCGGDGIYKWGAVINGCPQYAGTCYKCEGAGKVWSKWIERTPEYQAKLDAKREAKHKAQAEAFAKAQAEREEKRKAEEEKRKAEEMARKAISQYIGETGKRITVQALYDYSASFEIKSFAGYGTETMYVHTFKDANGNKLVWKTSKDLNTWLDDGSLQTHEQGDCVQVTGTVKEHKEYRDEKQTALTRCKLEWIGDNNA